MPKAPQRFTRRPVAGRSFKQIIDKRRYGSQWAKTSKAFLKRHPVCHCDRVKAWDGCKVITIALAREGVFRPAALTDHIRPLSQGGVDEEENYQPLCSRCHARKTKRWG